MSHLSPRDRELAAIGAALGSNCVPCIEYHIPQAKKAGLSDGEIAEAIRLADKVRQVPARKVIDIALQLVGASSARTDGAQAAPAETEVVQPEAKR
jgi:AhpD family alkylhydroperoxidase